MINNLIKIRINNLIYFYKRVGRTRRLQQNAPTPNNEQDEIKPSDE